MTPHDLGLQLRALVFRDRQAGLAFDPQRLQAVVSDLAGAEHADLVAPLRYLILSPAFASAARQDPPLDGGPLLPRLRHELSAMYAEPVCARLQPVLEGLLGLSPAASPSGSPFANPAAAAPPPPAAAPPPPAAAAAYAPGPAPAAPARTGAGGVNSVLLLLCGALVLALAGVTGLWRMQRPQGGEAQQPPAVSSSGGQQLPGQTAPVAQAPSAATAAAPSAPAVPAIPAPPTDAGNATSGDTASSSSAAETASRAQGSVERLVSALSDKDFSQVDRLIGMGAADQFESGFYSQFDGVSVQDLRPTGQQGSTVTLEGVMVFRWPDGSRQSETRSFRVDTDHDPPLIVSSSFGRVIRQR